MRKLLQILALVVALGAAITWLVTGSNHGWTKTEVQIKTLDEVTGIEGITYRKKFQPGMDFLGVAFGTAISLAGASFFFRKPTKNNNQHQTGGTGLLTGRGSKI